MKGEIPCAQVLSDWGGPLAVTKWTRGGQPVMCEERKMFGL